MTAEAKRPTEHYFLAVLALGLIALHFVWFWQMYAVLATEGLGARSFGTGRLLVANLVIFLSVIGGLAAMATGAVRSFRARTDTSYLPTLLLLGGGTVAPWVGILLSGFIAGSTV